MVAIRYVPAEHKYRVLGTGRAIAATSVRAAVDRLADETSVRMASLTRRLIDREITIATWQAQMMRLSKDTLLAAAVVARGGRERMRPADWGYVGRVLRDQYAYLQRFALQLAAGSAPADGRAENRARLYGQQARVIYEQMQAREAQARGWDQEQNVLHPAEHCDECLALADLGWVRAGTLPPIGTRTCLSNCRCSIEHRATPATAEAARPILRVV